MTPHIVVLEGPDGVGKTHHARALAEALTSVGVPARRWQHERPPAGGTSWAKALHYAAEREHLRTQVVRGNYDGVRVLVCDRWLYSTRVVGLAIGDTALCVFARAENEMKPRPACVVLLDAPDDVLDARMTARDEEVSLHDRDMRRVYRRGTDLMLPESVHKADTNDRPEAVTASALWFVRGVLG